MIIIIIIIHPRDDTDRKEGGRGLASNKDILDVLYTNMHIHLYTYTCRIHIDAMNKTSEDFFKEIYLSLYCKVCMWKGVGDRTELQHIKPHSYGHQRCVFLVLLMLKRRPGGSAFSWLSLPLLVSNSSAFLLTDFLSTPSYIIVQSPTQYLWNGMFDRHQAEITVMQFIGHSLLVHQSMTVHGILPRPILSAKSADAISSHNCHRNVSLPSGASL